MLSAIKINTLNFSIIIIIITVITCANKEIVVHEGGNTMPAKAIEEVLKEHTEELMSISGVVGTAQGLCDDKPCIKIYVIKKTSELNQKIPDILEGYPVRIEETGEIRALPENRD